MKLICCINCNDVVRLVHTEWRMCDCKKSGGQYNEDLLSATVGGCCDVLGISNLFFDKDFRILSEPEKVDYRKKINHHPSEIWYGETKGDNQICRIKSSYGPRIKMKVNIIDKNHTKSIILDKRKYMMSGEKLKHIEIENEMKPSFIDKWHRNKNDKNEIKQRLKDIEDRWKK